MPRQPSESLSLPVSPEEVRAGLARILSSSAFRSSKRCQELLSFVVERTLEGNSSRLKERCIGVELFGRDASYDTHEDPIVRVKANEVRKRLALYYQEEGADAPFRIELPPGGYAVSMVSAAPPPASASPARWFPLPRRALRLAVGLCAGATAIIFLVLWIYASSRFDNHVKRFWGPFLDQEKPVSIILGESNLYQLSRRVHDRFLELHPEYLTNLVPYQLVPSPDLGIRPEDVVPVPNLNVNIADAVSIARLAVLFHDHHRQYQIAFGAAHSQPDFLGSSPAVVIGAFSNPLNIQLTRDLRFTYRRETTSTGASWLIADKKTGKSWRLIGVFPKQETDTDYALVTRLLRPTEGRPVVAFGGITQFGTQAAVEVLTDSAHLASLDRLLGRDWHKANLQFVLETRVAGRTPVSPRIVIAHRW
jgi:hypothetical protein